MKLVAIQMAVTLGDPESNFTKAEALIRQAMEGNDPPDVIVLPETWNLGFSPETIANHQADQNCQQTHDFCKRLSKELHVHLVAGSVVAKRNNDLYNTALVYSNQGECLAEYDKIHLFSMVNEGKYIQSGQSLATFQLDGVLCGIIICYDLRFPELARTLALRGISVLFVVAQWPMPRVQQWRILNQARAIENQIFVVATNGCGFTPDSKFAGNSMIVHPLGEILEELGEDEGLLAAEFAMNEIQRVRENINLLQDRMPHLYGSD